MTDELRIDERPQLERPVLIAAFRGWNDAGEAASTAASFLKDAWDAEPFAVIDPPVGVVVSFETVNVPLADALPAPLVAVTFFAPGVAAAST